STIPPSRPEHAMPLRLLALLATLLLIGGAGAQTKQRIEKAADLPRFTYQLDGSVEAMVRDDARFRAFAAQVRRDVESVLAGYDIADKATLRDLLGELAQLDYLDGHYDDALKRAAEVKALQDKPADKLLSGVTLRAMIEAERAAGGRGTDAYRKTVGARIASEL